MWDKHLWNAQRGTLWWKCIVFKRDGRPARWSITEHYPVSEWTCQHQYVKMSMDVKSQTFLSMLTFTINQTPYEFSLSLREVLIIFKYHIYDAVYFMQMCDQVSFACVLTLVFCFETQVTSQVSCPVTTRFQSSLPLLMSEINTSWRFNGILCFEKNHSYAASSSVYTQSKCSLCTTGISVRLESTTLN